MKPSALCTLIFLVFTALFPPVYAEDRPAAEPDIADIIITTSDTHLLLFATVKNCFTPEMITGVRNGIPIIFDFQIELDQVRNNWFDSSLVKYDIVHTLTYDNLKEEYRLELSERPNSVITTKSLDKAKEIMAELNGIRIIERNILVPDAPYALRIKAVLEKNVLPLGMHHMLPFTSLWDFETDWRVVEFRY